MALAVDAVVGRREDVVDLSECGDCLVEVEAKCDEVVVDRGLRGSPPGADSDDSEAACEVPWPRGAAGGRRDPGEDGRIWAWGVGEPEFVLVPFVAQTFRSKLASSWKVNSSIAVTDRAVRLK